MTALIRQDDHWQRNLIQAVLDSVQSTNTRRAYERTLKAFLGWHSDRGRPPLTKALVQRYKAELQEQGKKASVINQALSAIRKMVREAADNGAIDPIHANGIANVRGLKSETLPAGRNISSGELQAMISTCVQDPSIGGIRDAAIISISYACGLRRGEVVNLNLADYDRETGELKIIGAKGNKERLAYLANGGKAALDDWLSIRGDEPGPIDRKSVV